MAFYHEKGLVAAFQQAARFAGDHGRIATLPDIVNARLNTKPGTTPWEMYFTTMSAEYFGMSRSGNRILIVAHGVGPMANLDGILKAYSYHFKDNPDRRRRGGRISQQELWDLESGKYGDVSVIDYDRYVQRYEYPFLQQLRASDLCLDQLFEARFGSQAHQYAALHVREARKWHAEQAGVDPDNRYSSPEHERFCDRRHMMHRRMSGPTSDPFILQLGDAANCGYPYHPVEPGLAFAHLLSISQLQHTHHGEELPDGGRMNYESMTCEVDCHEWSNGARLIGVRGTGTVTNINHGAYNLTKMMAATWERLMRPVSKPTSTDGFYALMNFAGRTFTQYEKLGERMDTYEPKFLVTSMTRIAEGPATFRTTVGGYHGFFKYGIKEVERIAPRGANAYLLPGEIKMEWHNGNPTHHVTPVEFYRVEVDTTQRMLRQDEVRADYDLMMSLM